MSGLRNSSIVVIDVLDLRRIGILSMLEPWAEARGLDLTSLTPDEIFKSRRVDADMIIFSLGEESISKPENVQIVENLRSLAPKIPFVIVADRADPYEVATALNLGAEGFISSDVRRQLAVQALSFILGGGSYFPASALRQLRSPSSQGHSPSSNSVSDPPPTSFDKADPPLKETTSRQLYLTAREKLVLKYMCEGEPNKLIARRLGVTEGTIKSHVHQIVRKLGVVNRTQAALYAMGPDHVPAQSRINVPKTSS